MLKVSVQSSCEYLVIKTNISNNNIGISVIYRPPSSHYTDIDVLRDIFCHFMENNLLNYIVLGDININMKLNNIYSNYVNTILHEFSSRQIIQSSTRITEESETLIDVIIVNNDLEVLESDVLDICLSDHNIIACKININFVNSNNINTFRSYKNFHKESFQNDLNVIDWNTMYRMESLDEKVEYFNNIIIDLFDKHAPTITQCRRNKKPNMPWFTQNLKHMKNMKVNAWNRYKKTQSQSSREYYCQIRNFYACAVKNEKRAYFKTKLNECKSDSKKLWSTLQSQGVVNKPPIANLPDKFDNPDLINDHFIDSIPPPEIDNNYQANFNNSLFSNSLCFEYIPVQTEAISKLIKKQKPHTMGSDGISGRMLQLSLPLISVPLTHIINISFEMGSVASLWKTSIVKPIPKMRDPDNLNDLRPISLLSVPLKIAEAALHEQLATYATINNVLPHNQSGFREKHSTTTALTTVVDDILGATDQSKSTSLILLDMSKAFDSISIDVLIGKLKYYGLSNNLLDWMESYLKGRRQIVCLNSSVGKIYSEPKKKSYLWSTPRLSPRASSVQHFHL